MSGITSAVEPIFSGIGDVASGLGSGVGSIISAVGPTVAKSALIDTNLSAQQSQREAEAQANADAKTAELTDSANQQIALRNQALQKGLSHARAFFAAQGVDPNSGSADTYASAQTADTNALNDYTNTQLNNSIADLNRGVANVDANDLLNRTQTMQDQLFSGFLS